MPMMLFAAVTHGRALQLPAAVAQARSSTSYTMILSDEFFTCWIFHATSSLKPEVVPALVFGGLAWVFSGRRGIAGGRSCPNDRYEFIG